ncbi:MAG: glycoside hydrolase family 55 protein, partial [Verrucomicrobiota bacterium]|nr:glycoside hydrolase family 55 protein [Verrucomicrobiota bacterium]
MHSPRWFVMAVSFALLLAATAFAQVKLPTPPSNDARSFGAVGDGVADDTAAIQKAVNAGAGAVRFTKGVYRLTRTVAIELDKVGFTSLIGDGTARIVMAGAGPAFKFVGTHEGSAAPNEFKP